MPPYPALTVSIEALLTLIYWDHVSSGRKNAMAGTPAGAERAANKGRIECLESGLLEPDGDSYRPTSNGSKVLAENVRIMLAQFELD